MSGPVTTAGRALLDRESFNERSFALITPSGVEAIEREAVALTMADLRARLRSVLWKTDVYWRFANPEKGHGDILRFADEIADRLALIDDATKGDGA